MKKINSNLIYRARLQGIHIDTRGRKIQIAENDKKLVDNVYVKRLCNECDFVVQSVIEYTIDKRVFISGEPSDIEGCEYNKFIIVEINLRNSNYHPVNPFKSPYCDKVSVSFKDEIKMLSESECIYFLPGWTKSDKCRLEFDIATRLGLEILKIPKE